MHDVVRQTCAPSTAEPLPRDSRRLMMHALRRGMVLTRDPNRPGSAYWRLARPMVEGMRIASVRDDDETMRYNGAYGRKYGWEVHRGGRSMLEAMESDLQILWLSDEGLRRSVRHHGPVEVDLSHLRRSARAGTKMGHPAADDPGIDREISLLVEIERRLATTGRYDGSSRSPDEVTAQALAIYCRMSEAVRDGERTRCGARHDAVAGSSVLTFCLP